MIDIKKWKKIIFDLFMTFMSSPIPVAVLQLLILPGIANKCGDVIYGNIVSTVSAMSLVSIPFGNPINNVRILYNDRYEENDLQGDFNPIIFVNTILGLVCLLIIFQINKYDVSAFEMFLIFITVFMMILREYTVAIFRVRLFYAGILINNIILTLGYLAGFGLFFLTECWPFIYLIGNAASLLHSVLYENLLSKSYRITRFFKETLRMVGILTAVSFMSNIIVYADRLILYPLIGASALSVYYSATIISKIVSIGIGPISGVMLGYISKMKKFDRKYFHMLIAVSLCVAIFTYFICMLISRPLLYYLYPRWADESLKIVSITTATAVINALAIVMNPVILRFCNGIWQLWLSLAKTITYIICSYLGFYLMGLRGFCYGLMVAGVIMVLMTIGTYELSYKCNEASRM